MVYLILRSWPLLLPLTVLLAVGCVRNTPVSGRKQVLLMPESHEVALGVAAYREILENETLSTNPQYVELVNRVGKRIALATGEQYDWEFKVIASDMQNAFCLPGGKVAIYEGILPICENEAGLAVVMSHEVAHAVARHGGERLSQGAMVNGAKRAAAWVSRDLDETNREITLAAFGVATDVGFILPYSRKHETEADQMGLIYMAKAGYDPGEAPRFWQRFAAATAGDEKPPEFLSTHPSDERRSQDLAAQLPSAMELYRAAPSQFGLGQAIPRTTRYAAGRHAVQQASSTGAGWASAGAATAAPQGVAMPGGIQACLHGNCDHEHHLPGSPHLPTPHQPPYQLGGFPQGQPMAAPGGYPPGGEGPLPGAAGGGWSPAGTAGSGNSSAAGQGAPASWQPAAR